MDYYTQSEEAWNFAIGLSKIDGLTPSDDFLELVEREKRGEITTKDILEYLNEKYTKIAEEKRN